MLGAFCLARVSINESSSLVSKLLVSSRANVSGTISQLCKALQDPLIQRKITFEHKSLSSPLDFLKEHYHSGWSSRKA